MQFRSNEILPPHFKPCKIIIEPDDFGMHYMLYFYKECYHTIQFSSRTHFRW